MSYIWLGHCMVEGLNCTVTMHGKVLNDQMLKFVLSGKSLIAKGAYPYCRINVIYLNELIV